jgi:hypothetical protein
MSRASPLAGFQVTLSGRFWVTPEVPVVGRIISTTFKCAARFADVRAWAYTSSVILLFARRISS